MILFVYNHYSFIFIKCFYYYTHVGNINIASKSSKNFWFDLDYRKFNTHLTNRLINLFFVISLHFIDWMTHVPEVEVILPLIQWTLI